MREDRRQSGQATWASQRTAVRKASAQQRHGCVAGVRAKQWACRLDTRALVLDYVMSCLYLGQDKYIVDAIAQRDNQHNQLCV